MHEEHEAQTIHQIALNAAPCAIIVANEVGEICLCNHSAREILELFGKEWATADPAVLPPSLWEHLPENKEGKTLKSIEIDGEAYLCTIIRIQENDIQGYLIVLKEATELEETRAKLAEAQATKDELDAVIQACFDYIFVTDGQGNVLKVNDSYQRITGITPEEVLGKNIYDLVKQGYYDRAATVDIIETKKSTTFTQTILKTGKTVLVTGNPLFNENGELVRVVTNGRDITELNRLKQQVEQAESLGLHYQRELQKMQMEGTGDYIVASSKMLEIHQLITRIAQVDSMVIIYGESGVGKEIVAREIHRNSLRADRPYICINCAAIPDNLLESELFGYEPGAFTGAQRGGKMGIFQLANGGTLFLDEIGEVPYYLQAKLLRVIQENEIMRIGGTRPIPIDVRIITATNRNLWQMVNERQFRDDFYYRLNVIQVRIPPLRERKEEISVFADYFIGMLNKKYKLDKQLDPMIYHRLMEYDWPGNIRELRNALEQAFVTSPGSLIAGVSLGPQHSNSYNSSNPFELMEEDSPVQLTEAVQKFESKLIKEALEKHGSTRKAAAALGVSQATIWRKARQYGFDLNEG